MLTGGGHKCILYKYCLKWWYRMSKVYMIPYYPVGSILEFDRAMDMKSIYGGTWELYGTGRMTVGINTSDANFAIVGKTGGSIELQSHTHTATAGDGIVSNGIIRMLGAVGVTPNLDASAGFGGSHVNGWINNNNFYKDSPSGSSNFPGSNHKHVVNVANAGTGTAGNMPPYIVVYRYRKVTD